MIHLLISASIVGSPACQIVYFPGSNLLNMINDAGTALVSATGVAVGQAGLLSNSRCSVSTSLAYRTQATNALTLTISGQLRSGFCGPKERVLQRFRQCGPTHSLGGWIDYAGSVIDGLRFACVPGCTNCCRVQGWVYITEEDLQRAAAFLRLSAADFEAQYVVRTKHTLRLRKPKGSQCHFLQDGGCQIHPAKPVQCRLFSLLARIGRESRPME